MKSLSHRLVFLTILLVTSSVFADCGLPEFCSLVGKRLVSQSVNPQGGRDTYDVMLVPLTSTSPESHMLNFSFVGVSQIMSSFNLWPATLHGQLINAPSEVTEVKHMNGFLQVIITKYGNSMSPWWASGSQTKIDIGSLAVRITTIKAKSVLQRQSSTATYTIR